MSIFLCMLEFRAGIPGIAPIVSKIRRQWVRNRKSDCCSIQKFSIKSRKYFQTGVWLRLHCVLSPPTRLLIKMPAGPSKTLHKTPQLSIKGGGTMNRMYTSIPGGKYMCRSRKTHYLDERTLFLLIQNFVGKKIIIIYSRPHFSNNGKIICPSSFPRKQKCQRNSVLENNFLEKQAISQLRMDRISKTDC